jgi:phosphatidylserine decarboxylase
MKTVFILLQRIVPQHFLSRCVAKLANLRVPWIKNPLINLFVAVFGVDLGEAEMPSARDYDSFNHFFTRKLRPSIRPVSGEVSSPADGTVSMAGVLAGNQILQAKGITYSLEKLLAGHATSPFVDGSFLTVYLSPRDYHRIHMPVRASLKTACYVPGRLFSVNRSTTTSIPDLFAGNERLVMGFDSVLGPMCIVMVGAMIVAGIRTVWRPSPYPPNKPATEKFATPQQFDQGAELGHFEMGSTVIILFQEQLDWIVKAEDRVKVGQAVIDG